MGNIDTHPHAGVFEKLKRLFSDTGIYGTGEVATSALNFLLLPVYTRYLSPSDYGVIALVIVLEAATKILFRWGIDGAYLRLYYDCQSDDARRKLTSTLFAFLFVVNGIVVAFTTIQASIISHWLFGSVEYADLLRMVLLNTFVISFFFFPYSVLRVEERTKPVAVLAFSRSASVLIMRLLFVVGAGTGVRGVVLADLVVSVGFAIVAAKWVLPLLRMTFSKVVIREALSFGLPRVPHGIAHSAIALSDRYLLSLFVTITEVGVYSIGATFSLAIKLFLGAFDYAWTPFYLSLMKDRQAKQIFSKVTTYVFGVEVLLVTGLSAIGGDLVRLMTTSEFYGASVVVPWVALGVLFQGVYQLTVIGLNITKRTRYLPVATGIAALVSITGNLVLIPRYGVIGAAWASAISYAVLALIAMRLSQMHYYIDYEWGRLAKVAISALVAYALARLFVPSVSHSSTAVAIRGGVVLFAYGSSLWLLGFFDVMERRKLWKWFVAGRLASNVDAKTNDSLGIAKIVNGRADLFTSQRDD